MVITMVITMFTIMIQDSECDHHDQHDHDDDDHHQKVFIGIPEAARAEVLQTLSMRTLSGLYYGMCCLGHFGRTVRHP